MRLIIASHKGGVGKSTISLNLAVAFAELGFRTALVDTDPQGALNLSLARGNLEFPGLADIMWAKTELAKVLIQSKLPNLSLLTKGRLSMKNVPKFETVIFQSNKLAPIIDELERDFDLVLFDTPAGLGMITRAVLKVGTHVLAPFKVDTLNLRSINQILQIVDVVQKEENPHLEFLGFLLNMFEKEKDVSYHIAGELWRDFPAVLDTTIPHVDIFAKASQLGVPLALIGKRKHPEAKRFTALAEEVMVLVNPEEEPDEDRHVRQLL